MAAQSSSGTVTATFNVQVITKTAGNLSGKIALTPSAGLSLLNHTPEKNYAVIDRKGVAARDTVQVALTVSYNAAAKPFGLENLTLRYLDGAGTQLAAAPAFLYFTPYNTLEVWSRDGLDSLKRVWDTPTNTPTRQAATKASVPVSDLTYAEVADPTVPKKYRSVPGLAYSVPVRDPNNGDDVGEEEGEIIDGTYQYRRRTWAGTISGRIATDQMGGIGGLLPVTGIRVELWDKDGLFDDFLAAGHTDDAGRFSFYFNHSSSGEGSYLELYLMVIAVNDGRTIQVITRLTGPRDGSIRKSNPHDYHHTVNAYDFGDVSPGRSTVKPHLLHYANQSRKFVQRTLGTSVLPNSSNDPLKLMITPFNGAGDNAFFMPGGYRNLAATVGILGWSVAAIYLSNDDCLYIGDQEEDEETAYHEFGHYLMWHMQNQSWANIFEASFATHYASTNSNQKLAWTEGWATGFSWIMSAYTRRYRSASSINYIDEPEQDNLFWIRRVESQRTLVKNGSTSQGYPLTHGQLSESLIGAAIYDLWDGDANLSLTPNNPAPASNTTLAHTDQDKYLESIFIDRVGLSFAEICAPIRNRPGNGIWGIGLFSSSVVQNVVDYQKYVTEDRGGCALRRAVADVFTLNRISEFPVQAGNRTGVPVFKQGSDELYQQGGASCELFSYDDDDNNYPKTGNEQVNIGQLDVYQFPTGARYNLGSTAASGTGYLSDNLVIGENNSLLINKAGEKGWPGSGQNVPNGAPYTADLCGEIRITVTQKGLVQLGDAATSNVATVALTSGYGGGRGSLLDVQRGGTLLISAGSTLVVQPGATLVLRNGSTLKLNGTLRIENGGYLCVERGANTDVATSATWYIGPTALLSHPAYLALNPAPICNNQVAVCGTLSGGNPNVVNTATTQNDALAFDGVNDLVKLPNNGSPAFSIGTQFTIEAHLHSTRSGGYSQSILTNRVAQTGAKGFLLALYGNGDLLLQLDGMNYGYQQSGTNIPFDGRSHHVAVTRDAANQLRFYIDGVPAAYAPITARNAATSAPLYIGGDMYNGSAAESFQGQIGEVRLWRVARSAADIAAASTQVLTTAGGALPDLVAYYDFISTGTLQTVSDLSQYNVAGTLGLTAAAETTDPTWVPYCSVLNRVNGNFRAAAPRGGKTLQLARGGGVLPDTLGEARPAPLTGPAVGTRARAAATYRVVPNPAVGSAVLEMELPMNAELQIRLLDATGQLRATVLPRTLWEAGRQQVALPVRGLRPGIYLVVVESAGERWTARLQIQ